MHMGPRQPFPSPSGRASFLGSSLQETVQMFLTDFYAGWATNEEVDAATWIEKSLEKLAAGPAGGGLGLEIDVVPLGGQRHYIFSGIVHHLFNEDSFKKRKKRKKPEKVLEKKAIQHAAGIVLSPGLSTLHPQVS